MTGSSHGVWGGSGGVLVDGWMSWKYNQFSQLSFGWAELGKNDHFLAKKFFYLGIMICYSVTISFMDTKRFVPIIRQI